MGTKTPDDPLASYIAEFGADDGPIVFHLTYNISQLALEWRLFLYFYCGPKERVDVLNCASGLTTRLLRNVLWDSAILKVRTLTDPGEKGGNKNLSLEQLCRIAKSKASVDLSSSLGKVKYTCDNTREFTSKYIAHSDLDHAVGSKCVKVIRRETTDTIKAICEFLKEFHRQVRNTEYRITPITGSSDQQQFLTRLHQGNEFEAAENATRIERIRQGDWKAADESNLPAWLWSSEFRDDPF